MITPNRTTTLEAITDDAFDFHGAHQLALKALMAIAGNPNSEDKYRLKAAQLLLRYRYSGRTGLIEKRQELWD